jgi:hypothetical protein
VLPAEPFSCCIPPFLGWEQQKHYPLSNNKEDQQVCTIVFIRTLKHHKNLRAILKSQATYAKTKAYLHHTTSGQI